MNPETQTTSDPNVVVVPIAFLVDRFSTKIIRYQSTDYITLQYGQPGADYPKQLCTWQGKRINGKGYTLKDLVVDDGLEAQERSGYDLRNFLNLQTQVTDGKKKKMN